MNKLKRYIPELVYNEIKQSNYKNKDHLYVICDMIYRSTIYKKQDDYSGYIDIPSYYFEDIIKNYKEYINYLLENNFILCDNIYSKQGGKALGYIFNDKYVSKLVPVEIEKLTLKQRIVRNRNTRNNDTRLFKEYKKYFLNNFSIDYDSAIKYLDSEFKECLRLLKELMELKPKPFICPSPLSYSFLCSPKLPGQPQIVDYRDPDNLKRAINRYNSYFIQLNSIKDKDLFFRKNKTNGRIDTNLTNLKSKFKQFIKSDTELYQIDIINSQPFILSLYLDLLLVNQILTPEQKIELDKYRNWTSTGKYYDYFYLTYFKDTGKELNRQDIKDITFCILFSKNGSYTPQKRIFKSIFPFILSIIEKQKENKHNEFAIKLQKLESEICIDIICKELDEQKIKYYTIHDAWLINVNDIKQTKKIIIEKFIEKYNNKPELKIEKI